jgi:hypothetical protein
MEVLMVGERSLRTKIRKRIQNIVREELGNILEGLSAGLDGVGRAGKAPHRRKRRPAGWLARQVDKVLVGGVKLRVAEIAARIGKGVTPGLVNAYLSRNKGILFSADNSRGPRKTRWSMIPVKAKEKK